MTATAPVSRLRLHLGRPLERPDLVDTVVAVAVAAISLVEVLSGQVAAPTATGVVVALAFGAAVWFWRVWPVASLVAVYALIVLCVPLQVDETNFLGSVIPAILVLAATAARCRLREAVAWFAVCYAVLLGTALTDPGGWLWGAFLLAGAFTAGRLIHQRRLLIDELRATTAELERSRDLQARTAVADERARIARELHDVVAHSVSVMVVQAGAAQRMVAVDRTRADQSLEAVQQTGRQALTELRRLLGVLRPGEDASGLSPQPGLDDLEQLTTPVQQAGVAIAVERLGDVRPLTIGVELTAYRILQEALTNVLRHAHATHASVTLSYGADTLELAVVDDGVGGPSLVSGSGHGLIGMTERASVYGGHVVAGCEAGGGYTVRARLPLTAPS
jgi:signal transduction histidine kinase